MSDIDFTALFYVCPISPSGLRYCKDTPAKRGIPARSRGDVVGIKGKTHRTGYWRVLVRGRPLVSHRIVFEMVHGRKPALQIDHIDGDKDNNSIDNLREATPIINARNRKMQDRNKSGKNGVDRFTFNGYEYWRARWYSAEGKLTNKQFPIKKLGDTSAFEAACAYRDNMTAAVGGYTARHGTADQPKA